MVQDLPHIYILNLNNKDHILPIQIKIIIKKKNRVETILMELKIGP